MNLPTLEQIQRERYRRRLANSFTEFTKAAWEVADPARLVWGWHLDALCLCLQAVTEKRIKNLLINIPPGHAKSMIVSVLWPAWNWARDPKWSGMFGSYELGLVMRDSVKARALIESQWFTETFRQTTAGALRWDMSGDLNTKKAYANTAKGIRQGTSVGLGTGYRGDVLVVDDPLSVAQALSEPEREAANHWFFEMMPTRFNDMSSAQKVVIMQRLHEQDVSGEILSREGSAWQHLCLPAEFDPDRKAVVRDTSGAIVFEDPRKVKGELLFPAKFPREVVDGLKKSLGPYSASGQLDQRPSPLGGGVLKAEWFRARWTLPGEHVRPGNDPACGVPLVGVPLPTPITHTFMVTDAAFKDEKHNDRVAIGVWGFKYPNLYLLDLVWDQMDFLATCAAIRKLKALWGCRDIVIEEAANGIAILNVLRLEFPAVLPVKPEGSKVARIMASAPFLAAGNVLYPHSPRFSPSPAGNVASVDDLIGEATAFPKGRRDDGIDMQAYAVNKFLADSEVTGLLSLGQAAPVALPSGAPAPQNREQAMDLSALAAAFGSVLGP